MRIQLYSIFENDKGFDNITNLWNSTAIRYTIADEDTSAPGNYIQLRYDVTNSPRVLGDGITALRQSDCDIMIITTGAFEPTLGILDAKVAEMLDNLEIPFTKVNLGYDKGLDQSQITYSVVLYGR